jgi:PAS domain S-box-containing protein
MSTTPSSSDTPDGQLGDEASYRRLVDGMLDYGILMLDTDGTVRTWNAGAERMKGYTADEVIGQNFEVFYPADLRAPGFPARELAAAAETGRFEDEGWRVRKDGSRFWANVILTALRGPDGELQGFLKLVFNSCALDFDVSPLAMGRDSARSHFHSATS